MPRPSKPIEALTTMPEMAGWAAFEKAAEREAAKFSEVSKETRLAYEKRHAKVIAKDSFDFTKMTPETRDAYKKGAKWVMRRQLRALLRQAKKLKSDGVTGGESFQVRATLWAAKLEEARQLMDRIEVIAAFKTRVSFEERKARMPEGHEGRIPLADEDCLRMQASHKQKAATDLELDKFFDWAEVNSSFAEFFLVSEFTGCRGAELGKGVRIEVEKKDGIATMTFTVEGVKCDGDKKGLELRSHSIPYPKDASEGVRRRWLTLAKMAAEKRGGRVFTLAPSGKSTPGRRFTEACRTVADGAGLKTRGYSFRHRISAQGKAANKGRADAGVQVALLMGHQTTNTGAHYGRAHRGGGGISPIQIEAHNLMGVQIRGEVKPAGPPQHMKDEVAIKKTLGKKPLPSKPKARQRL